MKNLIVFKLLFVLFLASCNNKTQLSKDAHLGFWSGYDSDNKLVTLQLNSDGTAKLTTDNNTLDSNFQINDISMELRYLIDYTQNPIQLDLIIKEKESGKNHIVWEGIVDFISEKMFKYCLNFSDNDERFKSIDEAGTKNCINFEKK